MQLPSFIKRIFGLNIDKRGTTYSEVAYHNLYHATVSADKGSRVDAVFTSINTISREISSTPVDIKQEKENGKERIKNIPQYRLISAKPNNLMNASNFWYSVVFSYLTQGNAFCKIIRDGNFTPVRLDLLDPTKVKVEEIEGELFYIHQGSEVITSRDVLHFKLYSINGVMGVSPIEWNASLMNHKINQQDFSNNAIGSKPSGFLSGDLTSEQLEQLSHNWHGRMKDGKLPYINSADAKYNPLTISPNEAQYLETSKYTDRKIYSLFNLPPTFAQDFETGIKANSEQQALSLIKHTLMPHYVMIEQELNEKIFTERNKYSAYPKYVKFNVNSKLRGDISARKDWYQTLLTNGVISQNEVRELEDLPTVEGGDDFYIQGAMVKKGEVLTEEIQ